MNSLRSTVVGAISGTGARTIRNTEGSVVALRLVPRAEVMASALERAKSELRDVLGRVQDTDKELKGIRLDRNPSQEDIAKSVGLRAEMQLAIGTLSCQMPNIATIVKNSPKDCDARDALALMQRHPSHTIQEGARSMLEMAEMLLETIPKQPIDAN